jgi:hypothetical protein
MDQHGLQLAGNAIGFLVLEGVLLEGGIELDDTVVGKGGTRKGVY